jgi:hypothetical protein
MARGGDDPYLLFLMRLALEHLRYVEGWFASDEVGDEVEFAHQQVLHIL